MRGLMKTCIIAVALLLSSVALVSASGKARGKTGKARPVVVSLANAANDDDDSSSDASPVAPSGYRDDVDRSTGFSQAFQQSCVLTSPITAKSGFGSGNSGASQMYSSGISIPPPVFMPRMVVTDTSRDDSSLRLGSSPGLTKSSLVLGSSVLGRTSNPAVSFLAAKQPVQKSLVIDSTGSGVMPLMVATPLAPTTRQVNIELDTDWVAFKHGTEGEAYDHFVVWSGQAPVLIDVVALGAAGTMFTITDNEETNVYETNPVGVDRTTRTRDVAEAWGDSRWSKASFVGGRGQHTIRVYVKRNESTPRECYGAIRVRSLFRGEKTSGKYFIITTKVPYSMIREVAAAYDAVPATVTDENEKQIAKLGYDVLGEGKKIYVNSAGSGYAKNSVVYYKIGEKRGRGEVTSKTVDDGKERAVLCELIG